MIDLLDTNVVSQPGKDAGLAATAEVHGLVLVTRNTEHPRGRGVPLLNPFKSPAELVPSPDPTTLAGR